MTYFLIGFCSFATVALGRQAWKDGERFLGVGFAIPGASLWLLTVWVIVT